MNNTGINKIIFIISIFHAMKMLALKWIFVLEKLHKSKKNFMIWSIVVDPDPIWTIVDPDPYSE